MARRDEIVFEDEIHKSAWAWLLTGLGLGVMLITAAYLFVQVRDEHLSFRFLADFFTQKSAEQEKQTVLRSLEKYRQDIPLNYHELLTKKQQNDVAGQLQMQKPGPQQKPTKVEVKLAPLPSQKPVVVKKDSVKPKVVEPPQRVAKVEAPKPRVSTPASRPVPGKSGKPYVVQAGSFTQFNQADQMKARLAMNGYYAVIQKARVNNRSFYRVRLGPFSNKAKAQRVRQELASINIVAMTMAN